MPRPHPVSEPSHAVSEPLGQTPEPSHSVQECVSPVSKQPHPAPEPIDAIVFDFGNVLIPWDYRGAYDWLPDQTRTQFFEEFDFLAFNRHLDAGQPFADAVADLRAANNPWANTVAAYLEHFVKTLGEPVPGMLDLATELKTSGYRLYGLTNWGLDTFVLGFDKIPIRDLLDGVVVSGQEKIAKPDPRIFDILATRFDLTPSRTVFIDDSPTNTEAATALGFRSVLFTTTTALRSALSDLGVQVSATD